MGDISELWGWVPLTFPHGPLPRLWAWVSSSACTCLPMEAPQPGSCPCSLPCLTRDKEQAQKDEKTQVHPAAARWLGSPAPGRRFTGHLKSKLHQARLQGWAQCWSCFIHSTWQPRALLPGGSRKREATPALSLPALPAPPPGTLA